MIRVLRKKLVLSAMLSLFLVLAAIVGVMNIMNYRSIVTDADSALELIDTRDRTRPAERSINWRQAGPRFKSPEMPFEIRFFSIILNGAGEVDSVLTDRIAAVDEEKAGEYASLVLTRGTVSGFVDDYRYLVVKTDRETRITLLDCGRMLTSARYTLLYSALVSLAGLLAVFCLIEVFSGRIIRPFLDNYEKQKRFISDAGHELKTPLTVISADAELIEMENGGSEWVSDIKAQSARMAELTNRLIRLTKTEAPEDIRPIEFPLSDLVSDAVSSFRAPAKTQNKTIDADITPYLSFFGSENDIRQAINVILENAVQYSPENSAIRVTLKKGNRQLHFICENRAENIPERLTENMFDRFYRGDASRSSGKAGYGIGLSIAKAVFEAHRGKILAETVNGDTVRVIVRLPLKIDRK